MHMTIGLIIPITCLFFSILLNIVYFSKHRMKNLENKLYQYLIASNFIALAFEILNTYVSYADVPILKDIVLKVYLLLLLFWITTLSVYTVCVTKKSHHIYTPFWMISTIVFSLLIIVLPIEFVFEKYGPTIIGHGVELLYLVSFLYCTICAVIFLMYYKKNENYKVIPIFVYMILGMIMALIQKNNPGLLLITPVEAFVTAIMYFTIENPDLHMIQELNLAKDHAEKANKAKTDFLSNMSHEIRTPLNAIDGFSQVMLEEDDMEAMKEEANDIRTACQNLIELVNGILDISKIEANKIEIVNTEYDSHQMLHEVTTLVTSRLSGKNIEFRTKFDESIPQILYGDVKKIKQILLNLLTNAVKYTKKGYIEFKVDSVIEKNRCRLIFSVEDSGVGIKTEDISKLFTKFERLEMEKQSTIEGTGLGLAITKSLVELMGGKIIVQSKYGIGSKFTVSIDQEVKELTVSKTTALSDIPSVYSSSENEIQTQRIEIEFQDYSKKKILVVDDNKINLKVMNKLLEKYRPQLTTVESGFDCLAQAKKETYDLIFMDDMMPRMSGTETLHQLRENPDFNTPVVVLTANAIEGMKEKYLNAGFCEYLSKPINRKELDQILEKYLK